MTEYEIAVIDRLDRIINGLDKLLVVRTDNPAPAGHFANFPGNGPAPAADVGSPMEALFRFYPGKTEPQIQAIINSLSKTEFQLLPMYVQQKMAERTAYFHSADKNFVRPAWYDGVLKPTGGVDFSPTR